MAEFLDKTGVTTLWAKVKALFVDASPTQKGQVTTDTQWFGGAKGADQFSSLENFAIYRSNEGGSVNRLGRMYIDRNTVNNKEVPGHLTFRIYSPDTSGDMKTTGEVYSLPDVATDLSTTQTYSILTSKNAVTVAQGGTGATSASGARTNLGLGSVATMSKIPIANGGTNATTAADARSNLGLGDLATLSSVTVDKGGTGATSAEGARTNLGIGSTSLFSSTFTSSSSPVTLTDGKKYSFLTFMGRTNGTQFTIDGSSKYINTALTIPVANLSTSNVLYEIADYYGAFVFALKTSGNDVIMTYVYTTDTSAARIVRVYGTN